MIPVERERLIRLFEQLYDGTPWLDVNIVDTLEPLSAEQAGRKMRPDIHSVWEITHHLIAWRENVLQRLHGAVINTPTDNIFRPINDVSPEAWQDTLRRLKQSQDDWMRYLQQSTEASWHQVYPTNGMTYFEHIHGILQHDAYHLGQIRLLLRIN